MNNAPRMAFDTVANQALLAPRTAARTAPQASALRTWRRAEHPFNGLGFGYINGIAIDSAAHIACTSTEIDFSIQFYDLTTQTGFKVPIPGATSQAQSGQEFSSIRFHHLFLIGLCSRARRQRQQHPRLRRAWATSSSRSTG
jgi:hypothetical protein